MRQNKKGTVNNDVVNNNVLIDNFVAINDINNPDIESQKEIDRDAAEITLATKMNFARQIWLAGLGAYSNSIDGLNIAGEKSSMFFEELLRQGEKVDNAFKLHTTAEHISLHGLEKLIQRTYAKLTGIESDKINQLNDKLDALLAEFTDKK
ncbi:MULTISPECIES: phasin family protein [unclassified Moritella]|uniref:phasin family protein n=1 Tax=unclassified Moritella TaxID=2637987 RepID=UPI001BAA6EB2|nr:MULTISPECIES: phasin family protein [unclassified Moritella]QUM86489.1 phasin family protein [Moritella sp. 28]QUM90714.1 phasin family protein [Moritella sp. 36]